MRPAILAASLLLAAGLARAEPVFPAGGAIGLEPPPGFAPAERFGGFAGPGGASILVVTFPPEAYAEMAAGMTDERLAAQGLTATARRPFAVAGRDGVLISGRQTVRGVALERLVLVFPAPGLTGLVTVNLTDPALRPAAEAALRSIAVRAPDLAAERAALPFVFEDAPGMRLRLVLMGNSALLLPPGAERAGNGPSMVIAGSFDARAPVAAERRAAEAEAALRGITRYRDLRVTRSEPREVAGAPGHVLLAEATEDGAPIRVAQWLAFPGDGGTLRAVADAPAGAFEAALPEFERVVAMLRRR